VRGLLDRILDGEAAAIAVEMIAAGNSPACLRSTRSDKAARTFASCKPFCLKIDRRRREQESDPLL
jgi:hypothetical protein